MFRRMVYDWIHLVRPDLAQAILSSQVTKQITSFNCLISMEFNFALRLRLFIRVILFVSCIHKSKFSLLYQTLIRLIYIKNLFFDFVLYIPILKLFLYCLSNNLRSLSIYDSVPQTNV